MDAVRSRSTSQENPEDLKREISGRIEETGNYFSISNSKPTVGYVAWLRGWKVGDKEVRVIRNGPISDTPFEANGWKVMRPDEYDGIVPQEGIERVEILLDEGVEIRALLIIDDLRHYHQSMIEKLRKRIQDRIREIDWAKTRGTVEKSITAFTSVLKSAATALSNRTKEKMSEVKWDKVTKEIGEGIKIVAVVLACLAVASVALPLLALAALPAAALTFDPVLVCVDSEDRWWAVYEWWD